MSKNNDPDDFNKMHLTYYLHILANIVIDKYFNDNCFMVVSHQSFDYIGSIPFVNVKISSDFNVISQALNLSCQNFVVHADKPEQVISQLEHQIRFKTQRFNLRKYLILLSDPIIDLKKFSALIHYLPDVLFISPESDTECNLSLKFNENECEIKFYLATNKFVGIDNNDDIVFLDEWFSKNRSFVHKNDLYPDKISDMQGRVFKIATFNYKPYSIVDDEKDGIEMRIGLEYIKKHNCTSAFVVDDIYEWGEIYDNWTGNGVLGNLVLNSADIGFAALYTWYHEYKFLDLSMPVVRTGITCLVPAPRLLPGWLSPFFPFNSTLWFAVIVSFVVAVLSFMVVSYLNVEQRKRENDYALSAMDHRFLIFLLVVRIFLLQSWPAFRNLERPSIRWMLSAMLVVSLLVAASYNSGLASSMTVPRYEKPIKTVRDLAESNLNWGATHEAWVFSIVSVKQPLIVKILHNFKVLSERQLKSRTNTRDYAFSIERLPGGNFAIGEYITQKSVADLFLMSEDIYWEYCVIMSKKSSPFMPSLNKLILRIHEAGLLSIWETQVALRHLDYYVQLRVKISALEHNQQEGPTKLMFSHVQGVYVLWVSGLVIASICFAVELIVFKCLPDS